MSNQIKIYVVDENKANLEPLKYQLCEIFGRLTKYPNLKGLWLNPTTKRIICDDVTVFEIWTDKSLDEIEQTSLKAIVESIKRLTSQDSQLYTINNKAVFI